MAGDFAHHARPAHTCGNAEKHRIAGSGQPRKQCVRAGPITTAAPATGIRTRVSIIAGNRPNAIAETTTAAKPRRPDAERSVVANHVLHAVDQRHAGHQDQCGSNQAERRAAGDIEMHANPTEHTPHKRDRKGCQHRVHAMRSQGQARPGGPRVPHTRHGKKLPQSPPNNRLRGWQRSRRARPSPAILDRRAGRARWHQVPHAPRSAAAGCLPPHRRPPSTLRSPPCRRSFLAACAHLGDEMVSIDDREDQRLIAQRHMAPRSRTPLRGA